MKQQKKKMILLKKENDNNNEVIDLENDHDHNCKKKGLQRTS